MQPHWPAATHMPCWPQSKLHDPHEAVPVSDASQPSLASWLQSANPSAQAQAPATHP